jgi:hypothetical protein
VAFSAGGDGGERSPEHQRDHGCLSGCGDQTKSEDGSEEHRIVGVTVYPVTDSFALGFQTETGRILRLRAPWDRLHDLANALLTAATERLAHGDV